MKKTILTSTIALSLAFTACSGNIEHSSDSIPSDEVVDSIADCAEHIELPPALKVSHDTVDSVEFIIMKMDPYRCHLTMADSVMPSKSDSTVLLCVEAAFTGELLKEFKTINVAGDYVINGKFHKGYKCKANTGFLCALEGSSGCTVIIGPTSECQEWLGKAKDFNGTLFQQILIVHNGKNVYKNTPIKPATQNIYRAACNMNDGGFAVIQSIAKLPLRQFISSLIKLGVKDALYLDMGTGWNYGWYRESPSSPAVELFKVRSTYQTNWLVIKAK